MSRRHATLPLPEQRSDIQANLMHADWFASQSQTAQAVGLYRTVAAAAEAKGDRRIALTAYAAVVRLEGPASDANLGVGRMQVGLGNRRQGATTLDEVANQALQLGNVELGLTAYRLAADADPSTQRWQRLVDWCGHLGREDEARRHLEEGAAALFAQDAFAPFIPVARMLLAVQPDHVPTLRQLVRAHLHRSELHPAVQALQTILRARPGDPDALEHMAEAFAALGRPEKAAEVMARLVDVMLDRGPDGEVEARRLLRRGLTWRPGDSALLLLRKRARATAPPVPRAASEHDPPARLAAPGRPRRGAFTQRMPPLDLSEFVEAVPPEPPRPVEQQPPIEELSEHRYQLLDEASEHSDELIEEISEHRYQLVDEASSPW